MKFFSGLFLLLITTWGHAATIDTVDVYSPCMKRSFKCVVITPFVAGQKPVPVPVVYLLHGFDGSYSNWVSRVPDLGSCADQYQVMIVCPDAGNSWYFDSPVDPAFRFETYISKEVPAYIDSNYLTIPRRTARAITGLSMGGHGALFLAFRHSETFGACGSMSGGVDLQYTRNKYELAKRIGDTLRHADNWRNYSVMGVIERKPADSLAVILDCGINDFFLPANRGLHQKMLRLNIAHDYIERPGQHSWTYWGNAVEFQLLFFHRYFRSQQLK
ncbi:MAG TPA: alpha/beta hydrolase family protein [Flavisolibacter sp.]